MKYIEDLIKNSKNFCILPWIHFHSWPDGRVMPCCISDSNNPVSKIDTEKSILEMMNSDDFNAMRQLMINDQPVDICKRCYDLEKVGTWTMRQSHNRRRGKDYVDLVANTNEDGSINQFKMVYMDIRFSNICNMKCRSCGPACSSQWAAEHKEQHGIASLKDYFGTEKIVTNSNEDGKFFDQLQPYLDDVLEVYFAGGEILITPEHYDCLDHWIATGRAKDIELTYTTNFSSLKYKDKDLLSYWKHFPNLQIWASLDGRGSHAELIRKGTEWDKIVNNIRDIRKLVPHAQLQITPTISIWNVHSFPRFFDYLITQKLMNLKITPRFNLATSPWYANIMILPDFEREALSRLYNRYAQKYSFNVHIKNCFKMIEHALNSGSENKDGILEFIKDNDRLDRIRKEKLLDVIPELKKVYEWAKT